MIKEPTVLIFGNRQAKRCQSLSKQHGNQCGNPIARGGTTVCKFHGHNGGPKTEEGRRRCAAAKTTHGNQTRAKRAAYREGMRELHELEEVGRAMDIIVGVRTPGRKPG
jgi:hypothetical protein